MTDLNFFDDQLMTLNVDHLSNLKGLYLFRNIIQKVHQNSFANLRDLKNLHLNGNKIEKLPRDVFKNNLNLENTLIASASAECFDHLKFLKIVDFRNNFCID